MFSGTFYHRTRSGLGNIVSGAKGIGLDGYVNPDVSTPINQLTGSDVFSVVFRVFCNFTDGTYSTGYCVNRSRNELNFGGERG